MKNITFILIVFLVQFSLSQVMSVQNEIVEEDKGTRTLMKASVAPYTLSAGQNAMGNIGVYVAEWMCDRYFAPKAGSWFRPATLIRWINANSAAGNAKEEWRPVGQRIGGFIGSIALTATAMLLMDRYYFPWKRLATCFTGEDIGFDQLREGDSWKIVESIIFSTGLGILVYWDLKKKD